MSSAPRSTQRTAFISVYDKTDLDKLALPLVQEHGFQLVATGGTRRYLMSAGLEVKDLSDITGFDQLLDGRVKSLHPVVFASILARQDNPDDVAQLSELPPFELVCVNLYPFEQGLEQKQSGAQPDLDMIELIDIGGSTLLRASAKNHRYVSVLTKPKQYAAYLVQLKANNGSPSEAFRKELASQAFATSVAYDSAILGWLNPELAKQQRGAQAAASSKNVPAVAANASQEGLTSLPDTLSISLKQVQPMRYGENPHQPAALYEAADSSIWKAFAHPDQLLHGKPLSYNNVLDMEAAWSLVCEFAHETAVAIIKHTQPCGVAVAGTVHKAYEKALACDPLSAFGGIVACNRMVDEATAKAMSALFLEVIIAPSFTPEALEVLQAKKNLRLVTRYFPVEPNEAHPAQRNDGLWLRQVAPGRFLAQLVDYRGTEKTLETELKVVTEAKPSQEQLQELAFAWRICKHLKSNAIVVASGGKASGLCGGQTSRVGAVEKAITQACDEASGGVLASDGFFPAVDNIELAAQNRIAAIIQPGGSIKDPDVVAACNRYGIAMVTTGLREFKH